MNDRIVISDVVLQMTSVINNRSNFQLQMPKRLFRNVLRECVLRVECPLQLTNNKTMQTKTNQTTTNGTWLTWHDLQSQRK